jgi:tetratricopeptide (TPR) repeat protein
MLAEAIGHNPSFGAAHALLAQVLVLTGELDAGLERMQHAVRLGPRSFVSGLAVVHFVRREYAEGLSAAERALSINRAYPFARGIASACAFWLGRADVAQDHFRELYRIAPRFAPSVFRRHFGSDIEPVERVVEALDALRSGRSSPAVKQSG